MAFSFTSAGTVPNCSDVHGTGDSPPRGRTAVLFVRVPGHTRYYYEQPLRFDAARQTWRANRVVVGDQTSAGQRFELHAYAVSDSYAAELSTHDGEPYWVPSVPGERLGWTTVKRDDNAGSC
ncbi:hypothetical protein Phou_055090 [Phytohabitans houttuyneae]|uniref:Uncharacterized protein n=1 Tax=Phytohabitans houttuyneae TaxID=1076126 RepID=A0A6V8KGW3_9ACTN|nr:hypothetical protein Phou_055090 [Phytohabitans houttuyneae]